MSPHAKSQEAATPSTLIVDATDGVLQMTINAPEARNSLSAAGVIDGLVAALDQLERDPELRCAVLTGAGGAFCSGGNLGELASMSEAQSRARMSINAWLYRRIALCDKLIIAAVDGPAYGAGLGLAIARRIAQRHGGELTIDARATGTFAVTLSWPEPRRAPGRDRALGFVPG